MLLRKYNPDRDEQAALRIWREIGWIEAGNEGHNKGFRAFTSVGQSHVAELDGEAECFVSTAPGSVRYLEKDLPLSVVTTVATSHIARKQGRAIRLAARAVAEEAASGAAVSSLGMFEQGFYNRLGFGTCAYDHWMTFDPADIRVDRKVRPPRRITAKDWLPVHASRLRRLRSHGACNLTAPELTQSEMLWTPKGFGLGYSDSPGNEITHHLWLAATEMEYGPYVVKWMAFQNHEQFLELMVLLRSLGDQVHLIEMQEPQGIQLQDLVALPFRRQRISRKSDFEAGARAYASQQMRICDLAACLEAIQLEGDPIRFNLCLSDPITDYLDADAAWQGLAGDYMVTLGACSNLAPGLDPNLPMLSATVSAFTRMWLGVQSASGLAVTDQIEGPAELLRSLDSKLQLPQPRIDWDF